MSEARRKTADMNDPLLPPFTVTQTAIAQIEALGGTLMVDVEEGGCCGLTYAFRIVYEPTGSEREAESTEGKRFGCPGAWLLVGARAREVLPGATLDYSGTLKPPRFRILRNPNTPNVCSCRRSFGDPWPGPGQAECRSYRPMPWDDHFDPPNAWKRQTGYPDR